MAYRARLSLRHCRGTDKNGPPWKVLAFVSNDANKKKDLPDEGTTERTTRFENQLKAGGKAAFMEWFAFFVLADGSVMIGGIVQLLPLLATLLKLSLLNRDGDDFVSGFRVAQVDLTEFDDLATHRK